MSERKFVENIHEGDAPHTRVADGSSLGISSAQARAASAMKLRYAAFNEEAGIFLGVKNHPMQSGKLLIWSKIDPSGLTTAPTFATRDEFTRYLKEQDPSFEHLNFDFRMVQVFADLDKNYASLEALRKTALPVWA